jgi:AraC-like DNA-binding protein
VSPFKTTRFPSASGAVARFAYARARSAEVALQPLLDKAGLTRLQMRDRRQSLEVRAQIEFLNGVAAALSDELLGFHLARTADLREAGWLYYVLASSEVMCEVLRRAARYSSIVNEGVAQKYIDGRRVGIVLRYVGVHRHSDRHQMEFWATALLRMLRELTGTHLVPERVSFSHRRSEGCAELGAFFGCDIQFDAPRDDILFERRVGALPVLNADPHLSNLLLDYCEEVLSSAQRQRESLRSRIENIIAPILPHGTCQIGDVARRLGLSPRTLARRLESEGVTFSEVLQQLRRDLAARYLTEERLSISQIAWLLGYREVSAFSHAFKRWTGSAPREATRRRSGGVRTANPV